MQICGFNKTTLLDYPEHIAATIFTGGCNFRCPFCQNGGLVLHPEDYVSTTPEEILAFLQKRKGILSGVCITGGEPTLQSDLAPFIESIKKLGYLIKLDTNGYQPDVIQYLYEKGLIDYIAMDIKNSLTHYVQTTGLPSLDTKKIQLSVEYIMQSGIDYEFRTTVVKELHAMEDFIEIKNWIAGCKRYYLQSYVDSEHVICRQFHAYSKEELLTFTDVLKEQIPNTFLRGVE
ncbi:MAG: anaerobic ribonucleoside-triphosphate reductase activating protein [Lachnospiraceae bacterium]|nr:anaerobic ribonucleoside-triphosphate reductase activating protein [Lachnospiraceae bacterium]